jgi:transposase
LFRANGMSQRAIAAELGVSVGSVNAWLSVQ